MPDETFKEQGGPPTESTGADVCPIDATALTFNATSRVWECTEGHGFRLLQVTNDTGTGLYLLPDDMSVGGSVVTLISSEAMGMATGFPNEQTLAMQSDEDEGLATGYLYSWSAS